MTVLLTLQHHKLTDVVTVDPRAAAVGESSIELGGGEQMTVERPAEGHADPVGERRGRRARALDGAGLPVVRPPDERRGGEARPARHALRPARRARRARRVLERGGHHQARTPRHAHALRARHGARGDRDDLGRAHAAHLGRPAVGSSRRRSASRRATPTSPAGARSRRRAVEASRSTRRCWARRPGRSAMSTWSRS